MDRMLLQGMRFFGYHGVFPEENKLGQRYIVDLDLRLDLRAAAEQDDLKMTVNYAELHEKTKAIVEGPPFKLIEALAQAIASQLLVSYTIICELTVRVTKPHPPFAIEFNGVVVELRRKRDADGQITAVE